jgi:transposase
MFRYHHPPGVLISSVISSMMLFGPSGAARLLVEVGDITRFPDKARFASWNGTAPIDASSGDQVRHRLSQAGTGRFNRVQHIMARVQIPNPSDGRDYHEPKTADGKRRWRRCDA